MPSSLATAINGDFVKISWAAPYDGGSPLLNYQIQILQSDGVSFTADLKDCDGSNLVILSSNECNVPIYTLINTPYNHLWGASIKARVKATNLVGSSEFSTVQNGAIILTIPDAPVNLADEKLVTSMF